MSIDIQKAEERGSADFGWLKTRYSFSFANYHNPQRMGFGALRVLNDDTVAPGRGFGTHPHDNMEIITLVLDGTLEHKDSMGNFGLIKAGEVQRISAGLGIMHSEFNASKTDPVSLLQIWVVPKERDTTPSYEQKSFGKIRKNILVPLVLGKKGNGSLSMHQDGGFYLSYLEKGKLVSHRLTKGHGGYVIIIEGEAEVNDISLSPRDAISIADEQSITIKAKTESKALLIEIPLS